MQSFIDSNEWCLEAIHEIKQNEDYALDTETQGLDPHSHKLLLIQVGDAHGNVNIFDARKIDPDIMKTYLDYLFQVCHKLLLTNAPFDLKFLLKNYNIFPRKNTVVDVALNEWILYNGLEKPYYSYKYLVKKYCNVDLDKEVREQFIGYEKDTFSNELLKYAADDVTYIFDVASVQQYYLEKSNLSYIAELEGNTCIATAEMELTGVKIDTKAWLDIYQDNVEEEKLQLAKIQEMVKDLKFTYHKQKTGKDVEYDFSQKAFNPNSPDQALATIKHLGLTYKNYEKDKKGKSKLVDVIPTSTDAKIMEKIDHPLAKEITRYREIRKEYGTYGINFLDSINPVTGRIHCKFNQQGTQSGRYSSSEPNLQNIPRAKKYRMSFVETDGWLQITSDFSQFEMRLATEFSQDEVLLQAFFDDKDLHALSAAAMYEVPFEEVTKEQRSSGKTFNFSVLYGAQAFTVAQRLKIPYEQAEVLVTNWRKGFPGLASYLDRQAEFIRENRWASTGLGRRRYFDWDNKTGMNRAVREGCNHPIQGAAGDVLKIAQPAIFYRIREANLMAEQIRNVHDEISHRGLGKEAANIVKDIQRAEMEKAAKIYLKTVPVKIDTEISEIWSH